MTGGADKRRILVNAGSNGASYAATILVTFFVQPILVHGLGDEHFGIWLLVNSILAYMALGDLGVGAAVLRYVARFDGLQEDASINRVLSTSLAIFGGVGLLLLAVTLVLAFGWSRPLGVEPHLAYETRWLLTLLGVNLAFGLSLGLYLTVLEGLGRYPTINTIRIVGLLVRNGLFVGIICGGGGLVQIGVAITICSLTQNTAYAVFAHRRLPTLTFSVRYIDRATFRSIWGYSSLVFIARTAWNMGEQASPIIINLFVGPAGITYFGIARLLNSKAGDALKQMMRVVIPAVSKWEGTGDFFAVRSLLLVGTRYVLYLAMPIQLGLILLGHPFLRLWMGERYAVLSYPALVILAFPLPLILAYLLGSRILQGIGRVGFLSAAAVVRAVLTLVFAIVLVSRWGIEGVALATSIISTVHSLCVTIWLSHVTAMPLTTLLHRAYWKPLLLSTILVPVWISADRWLPPTSWSSLLSVGFIGLLLYGAAVFVADQGVRTDGTAFVAALTRMLFRSKPCATASLTPEGDSL
jgi:O-antigen/teichoic acid export membrane protein